MEWLFCSMRDAKFILGGHKLIEKRIFIIGNGFDLHHGLLTNYSDFKSFVEESNKELIGVVDSIFVERGFNPQEVSCWSILEEMIGTLPTFDYDDVLEDSFNGAESDMDRASYWHDPEYNATKSSEKLLKPNKLKDYFESWLKSIKLYDVIPDQNLDFHPRDLFLNFNFTQTLEKVYNIDEIRVWHIHGTIDKECKLGHNQIYDHPYHDPYDTYIDENGERTSDADFRAVQVKERINETYDLLFNCYYKNSKEIIEKNQKWFKEFDDVDNVIILGFSMGVEDQIYLSEIANHLKETCLIDVYFHDKKEKIENIAKKFFATNKLVFKHW